MGWTSYRATHYKWVGEGFDRKYIVDRKAECDQLFNWNDDYRECAVLKSTMVGSTYYAAVKFTKDEYSSVGAVICLTSTDINDGFNFSYKDMDETMGPYKYDCPKGILDLLTPTDSEYANSWRAKCREQLEKKKNPNSLSKLPEGSVIKVVLPFDTQRFKEGTEIKLTKEKWGKRCKWFVSGTSCYFTQGLMKMLDEHYEVIKRGE